MDSTITNAVGHNITLNLEALAYLYSRVPFQIQRAYQIATALFAKQQSTTPITPAQLQILRLLDEHGHMMQTELSNLAGTDKSTAGLVLTNLLKQHLVDRHTDPEDKRRKRVMITESGQAALAIAKTKQLEAEDILFEAMRPDQREKLMTLLERLADEQPAPHTASWLMRRCLQAVEAHLSNEAGLFGLTLRQFCALHVVFCHPGIGEPSIRKLLGYEITNATLVVGLLREKGLINAKSGTSASRKRYYATPMGRDVLLAVEPKLAAIATEFVRGFSDDDIAHLQRLLGQLILHHGDKVKAPLAAFAQVVALPSWPLPPAHTYVVEHRDALNELNNRAHRQKEPA
ncbi:MarR family winged helix-turn-helix transcriptional regulator [Noviherbaspirillum saxi]|uniref:MarR family winged helix-turn-helix transcriptional regulator n=1 Tax=Noviherbaspirillum saxi TaxID=2320863 RepID=UPI001314934C|nr:MarR family transcriptional regulator [Noviherbaspirillum saxi]